tara:strand:+ start:2438 stop:3769 length:1332 start_codon:yes stop_codon:yes gene_type:complete
MREYIIISIVTLLSIFNVKALEINLIRNSNINESTTAIFNDTTLEFTDSSEKENNKKHKLAIESGVIIENTSLNYKLFTSGNIDDYKQTISDGLLEKNILSVRTKNGVKYLNKNFSKKMGYSLAIYDRVEVDFGFSKDLFDLVFFGNEMFQGEEINLENTYLSATKFQQINLTLFRMFNFHENQIEVGLGYSYLIGNHHVDFSTNNSYIEVGDDGEYINSNLNFIANFADTNEFGLFGSNGAGYALNLSLDITLKDNSLHFSIEDFGNINWNKEAVNYMSKEEINFSGLEIDNILSINDSLIQSQLDSLVDINYVAKMNNFTSYLPTKLHFAYKRDLNFENSFSKNIDYVVIGFVEKYRKGLIPVEFNTRFYIGTNLSHKAFNAKTSYSIGGYSLNAWRMELSQMFFNRHFQLVFGTCHFESIFKGIDNRSADFYFSLNFLFN